MKKDQFEGNWQVREYVFDPKGTFQGEILQERHLRRLADGELLVQQVCHPQPKLDLDAMRHFKGKYVFSLRSQGPFRDYLGPDVLGRGTELGPGFMMGEGIWPRFGHNFMSYAFMSNSDRQVTGGFFFNGPALVAAISGVASSKEATAPSLKQEFKPWTLSRRWLGLATEVSGQCSPVKEYEIERVYNHAASYRDSYDGYEEDLYVHRRPHRDILRSGAASGVGKAYGCLYSSESYSVGGKKTFCLQVLDHHDLYKPTPSLFQAEKIRQPVGEDSYRLIHFRPADS